MMNSNRSNDQTSRDKSNLRHRRDLIDLSFEIDDATGSEVILDLFDPLKQDTVEKRQNEIDKNHKHYNIKLTDRSNQRSSQSTDGRRRIQRNRSSSTCASIYHEGPSTDSMDLKCNSSKPSHSIKIVINDSKIAHAPENPSSFNENGQPKEINKFYVVPNITTKSSTKAQTSRSLSRTFHRELSTSKNRTKDKSKCESQLQLKRKPYRSNIEMSDLAIKLKAFRSKFKHTDQNTNPGLVWSPTLYRSNNNSINIKVVITSPLASEPLSITCNVSTTIDHLISHALFSISEDPSDEANNYMLKVTGRDEYLRPEMSLADYVIVSNCCKFDLDIKLTMIKLSSIARPFLRTATDDFHCKSLLCPDDLLPRCSILKYSDLNYEALNIIIETFDREAQRLYQVVTNNSTCLQTQSLSQTTKAICSLMMNCESGQLTESKNNLSQLCASYRQEGDQLAEEDRHKMIEVIQHAIKRLLNNMHALLKLTSNNLPVDYEVLEIQPNKTVPCETEVVCPISLVSSQVTVKIHHVSQLNPEWLTRFQDFHIEIKLMFGQQLICNESISSTIRIDKSFFHRLLFDEEVTLNMEYAQLPREARFVFTLFGTEILPTVSPSNNQLTVPDEEPSTLRRSRSMNSVCSTAPMFTSSPKGSHSNLKLSDEPAQVPLATSIGYLFDSRLELVQGDKLLCMHSIDDPKKPYDIYHQTAPDRQDTVVVVEFKAFPGKKIQFPLNGSESDVKQEQVHRFEDLDPGYKFVIQSILENKDFQESLDIDEKGLLWEKRHYLCGIPVALPKLLSSVPYWSADNLEHIYSLLDSWSPMPPVEALQLLQPDYPDARVRATAVKWIAKQSDDELYDYLPQLLQVFRYEKHVDCALFWLLIERALRNVRMANLIYWQLKLNSQDRLLRDRSEILINSLLWVCGKAFWKSIDKQEYLIGQLGSISNEIERARDHNRLGLLRKKLEIVQDDLMDKKPILPCAPGIEVCDLDISSCYYFPSKTLPLKLAFRSCEQSSNGAVKFHNYDAIFKMGDDLRQDMIVIQMIRIMEKLWLREGLDLQMVTFDCMATNERQGLVEMVQKAETLRKIQQNSSYLAGSFDPKSIDNYLRLWNPSEQDYKKAVNRFLRSCAGYSVATYVLGICDRHNDNIMITNGGHLFHIDFGKFLGDAQMMGFIKRDRTPFVISTDMFYVINGGDRPSERFQTFVELSVNAFSIIRRNRILFLNLFSLMTSARIHNLNTESVNYVHKMLMPELSEAEAMAKFTKLIGKCINSRATQVNFFIHNLAHVSKSFISTNKKGGKNRAI